jgi:hypothetical protein
MGQCRDFLGYLTYLAVKAKDEGAVDQLTLILKGMVEEEAMRLPIKASREQPLTWVTKEMSISFWS